MAKKKPRRKKPAAALDANARWAIEREVIALIHRAARLADERRYREWVDQFSESGLYCAITRSNHDGQGLYLWHDDGSDSIQERAAYLEGVWRVPRGKTLHTVTNIEFTSVAATTAEARSNFVIYRTGEEQDSRLYACGVYHDQFTRTDGAWVFQRREVIVDTDLLPAEFTELL